MDKEIFEKAKNLLSSIRYLEDKRKKSRGNKKMLQLWSRVWL